MVLNDPGFKSCERIYTINFPLFLKIKFLDMFVKVYQIVAQLKISFICFAYVKVGMTSQFLRMFTVVTPTLT